LMFDTDKYASGLIAEYEREFASIKDKRIDYCEVGIYKGGSIDWAASFFTHPQTTITGIDLVVPERTWPVNSRIMGIDQKDFTAMNDRAGDRGYDIVIDDGCHFARETENTFAALWRTVKPGGVYIVEDWGAVFDSGVSAHYMGVPDLMMNIIKQCHYQIQEARIIYTRNGKTYAMFRKAA